MHPDTDLQDYDYSLKFVTLGESGVGKTCFLTRFCDGEFHTSYSTTIGLDFRQKRISRNGKNICLKMWDTAGQERFRGVTNSFYRNCPGFILIFDLTNRRTFDKIRDWLEQIRKNTGSEQVHIILVGNKTDLADRRMVTMEEALELGKEYSLPYVETSAATGENVDDAVYKVLDAILAIINKSGGQLQGSLYQLVPSPESDSMILDSPESSGKSCSC